MATPSNYLRPRVAVTLDAPFLGTRAQRTQQEASTESFFLPVRPKRVKVISNDHNEADRATVVTDWTQSGLDPRMLEDAIVTIYIANADEFDSWSPSASNVRFIGALKECEVSRAIDTSPEVTLEFVDYTDFFLRARPFGSSGIPSLDMTLQEAWELVCSQTPGADRLAKRLRPGIGVDPELKIGAGVAERFRKLAKVPTKPETDGWAVWQQCVGMLGLISFIDLDECAVVTATNYFTAKDSPRLLWGRDISEWSESRISEVANTGVGITSYDPLTMRSIEALYPPVGDERIKHKRISAKKIGDTNAVRQAEKRDYFAYPGITDPDFLLTIAQRVWEERSRQELEGRVTTKRMLIDRQGGTPFEILNLSAGDSVEVRTGKGDRNALANLPSDGARISYLVGQGYTPDAASLIARNMAEFASLGSKFLVRSVETTIEYTNDGGSFDVAIAYCNRIVVDGSTDDQVTT